jgi:UDP-N-acetylmuramoyl-tripeptide--D-alanyl-D-alanine ligase
MFFLNFLIFIFAIHQTLFWIYWWQTKEYRADRFWSFFKTDWRELFSEQFNLKKWRRPKTTFRGLLTAGASVFFLFLEVLFLKNFFFLTLGFNPLQITLINHLLTILFWFPKKIQIKRAGEKMKTFKGTVIGITGSFGKSSTKELLSFLLAKKYKVVKTEGNHNTLIGVAQTILEKVQGDEDFFVVEMGAYKKGEIKEICNLVRPKAGLITGLGDQHLDLFGSLANIRRTKYELFAAVPKNGLKLLATKDYLPNDLKDLKQQKDCLEFSLDKIKCRVPVLGKSLALNIAGAVKAAKFFGLSAKEIAARLNQLSKALFYPKLKKPGKEIYFIDDSYNAGLESFLSVLDYLKIYKGFKKIVATPGIIELGKKAKSDHLTIGKALKFIDKIIVTKPNNFNELNFYGKAELITNFEKVRRTIKSELQPKTVILFKGRVPADLMEIIL